MDGCEAKWLRSVVASIKRFLATDDVTVDEFGAELSHLAWSECAPTAIGTFLLDQGIDIHAVSDGASAVALVQSIDSDVKSAARWST